jgi:TetR/AcrR family transcriptional regulator
MESTTSASRRPGRPAQPIGRNNLIAIARAAFAEGGFAATSLSQIAERAGLRKASLYHHFPTKDALYLAVLDEVVQDLRALVEQAGQRQGGFAARLDRLGVLVTDYLAGHLSMAQLLVRELIGGEGYLAGPGRQQVQATLEAITAFLEAGMQAGEFRRQDPTQLALSIVGLHLFYFAAAPVACAFLRADACSPALVRARKAAIRAQVRALCLGPGHSQALPPRAPRRAP